MVVWSLLSVAGVTGLALGSYATTAAIRLARSEGSSLGRSHCDHCGQRLSMFRTVPIVSFFWSKGTCAFCGGRIDATHLVGEVLGAIVVVTAAATGDPVRGPLFAILGLTLLALSVVDERTLWMPKMLLALVTADTAALAALRSLETLGVGLVAASATLSILLGVRWLSARGGRQPGLGLGDVWLLSSFALWLGAKTPWLVVGASLLGLVAFMVPRAGDRRRPWGPAICTAGWVIGMAGEFGVWPTTV